MNENENIVAVENEVVAPAAAEAACDEVTTGHKVAFYVILGLIAVSGVGLPITIYLLIKEKKKNKQLIEAQAKAAAPEITTEATQEEKKEETPETK